jgi:hypothetical protein
VSLREFARAAALWVSVIGLIVASYARLLEAALRLLVEEWP